jgi:hypothetical protein
MSRSDLDERAAIVAFLRQRANASHPVEARARHSVPGGYRVAPGQHALSFSGRGLLLLMASQIQAGAHHAQ